MFRFYVKGILGDSYLNYFRKAIIYVRNRRRTKEITELLINEEITADFYHAGLDDATKEAFPVKKVTSSRSKKETVVITETELDQEALQAAISATGYDVGEIRKESWQKKGLFGR